MNVTVSQNITEMINTTVSPNMTTKPALYQADVVFMLDPSHTIGKGNLMQITMFISSTIDNLQVGVGGIRIGVVVIGVKPIIIMHLNEYKTRDEVIDALEKIPLKNYNTSMEGMCQSYFHNLF